MTRGWDTGLGEHSNVYATGQLSEVPYLNPRKPSLLRIGEKRAPGKSVGGGEIQSTNSVALYTTEQNRLLLPWLSACLWFLPLSKNWVVIRVHTIYYNDFLKWDVDEVTWEVKNLFSLPYASLLRQIIYAIPGHQSVDKLKWKHIMRGKNKHGWEWSGLLHRTSDINYLAWPRLDLSLAVARGPCCYE